MIRSIGFDFDGTLVQSNDIKREAYYAVTSRFGDVSGFVDKALAVNAGDRSAILSEVVRMAEAAGRLPPRGDGKAWSSALVEDYSRYCEDAISACPEVPGATEALESLSGSGYRLFVNSATPLPALEAVLARRGMARWFQATYGGFHGKTANLAHELELLGGDASALVFIGDNEMDRAAAEAVGCRFIGILNSNSGYRTVPGHLAADMNGVAGLLRAAVSNAGVPPLRARIT